MTPISPSSSDGSALPPRRRPSMGNSAKDNAEQDLWDFDDIDPLEEAAESLPKSRESGIPVPRDSAQIQVRQPQDPSASKIGGTQESVRASISKNRSKTPVPSASGQAEPGDELDDLDNWDEPEAARPLSEMPSETGVIPDAPTPPATAPTAAPLTPPADSQDELSPPVRDDASPSPLRPRLNLTKLEGTGLVALVVLLLIGGAMFFLNTINRLPTESGRVKANDFPIQGSHLTIVSANSFWRAPEAADTVRRGTRLLPVVDLTTSGGPAAIRVFFRNSDGDVIGDAVTRSVKSGGQLQIAATSGFDDVGMHAAYRTGDDKPWTIEVLEAPSENTPGSEFRRLFEMDISTDRR